MNLKQALLLISASLIAFSTLAFESIDTTNYHSTWIKIGHLTQPHVLAIARFAVKQHNTEVGTNLMLLDVVTGHRNIGGKVQECQLLLRAINLDNNTITYYDTLVHEQEPMLPKHLKYFGKAHSVIYIDEYEI